MLDRTQAPSFQRTTAYPLLQPQKRVLNNGADFYVIRGGDQPVVRIEFVLKSGRWFETTPGAAHFTATLLNKGTSQLTSLQIAEAFDQYGAHLDISPGLDLTIISVYTLSEHLRPVLETVYQLITDPTFPEDELEIARTIFLQNLKINLEKTSFLASRKFKEVLFGVHHPYGRELSEESVQELQRSHLVECYEANFQDFFVMATGQFSDVDLEWIASLAGKIPYRANENQVLFSPLPGVSGYLERPGSLQTSLRHGKFIPDRRSPEYGKILLLNHLFGGYFGSRLMKNLREEKGLTYGIYSSINAQLQANYLLIAADVNSAERLLAQEEIQKELLRLAKEPVPASEFEITQNHFIGSLQGELSNIFSHADKVRSQVVNNLEPSYFQNLITTIDQTTSDELMHLAGIWFRPEDFLEVAVG